MYEGDRYSLGIDRIEDHVYTAKDLLTREWPEPPWAIHGILPVGLSLLAGPPKVGKSWLALQIARAVAAGDGTLGEIASQGRVMVLALEDPPRRLHDRMRRQGWDPELPADFIDLSKFSQLVGDLPSGGAERLSDHIRRKAVRLLVIDTFSRAFSGDQNEVETVTTSLMPIQRMAHEQDCAVLLVDHHRKSTGDVQDPIADVLGSTAKGAMADTILGLYQVRGKSGARLTITGREVAQTSLEMQLVWPSGLWELTRPNDGLTEAQRCTYESLEASDYVSSQVLADFMQRNRGSVHKDLVELKNKGYVIQNEKGAWRRI
jgi:RecA-family ATPase/biotin operon repressor